MIPIQFEYELSTCKFIPSIVRSAVAVYQAFWIWEPGNMCCLHIALDDNNLEDDHVEFCFDQARKQDHPECAVMASTLLGMTEEERWLLTWLTTIWEETLRDSNDSRWARKHNLT